MKAPIDWLKDYVDINVSTKELADAMTMSGSKVEGIEVQGEEITKVVVEKYFLLKSIPMPTGCRWQRWMWAARYYR